MNTIEAKSDSLLVYLDSQDFSRFSASHPDYRRLEPVRRELLSLKERKVVRYAFSDIHIFECMPTDPLRPHHGLERIRTIAEFCEGSSLPSVSTIVEREVGTTGGVASPPEWSEWYPYFEVEEPDRKEIYSEVISELASNRKQRRAMAKLSRKPFTASDGRQFAEKLLREYPFMHRGEAVIQAYVQGHRPWSEVVRALQEGMRDIVGFSEWLIANWDQGQKFVGGLREGNRKVKGTLVDLHGNMKESFRESPIDHVQAREILKSIYKKRRAHFFLEFVQRFRSNFVGQLSEKMDVVQGNAHVAPSLHATFNFIFEILYRSSLPKNPLNPEKRSGSDFADAMHVMYVPLVHIFRADRFSCSVLSQISPHERSRFCSSLSELPERIKRMHSQEKT